MIIASTLPYLIDYKGQYGSIIKGLEANKQKFRIGEKKFFSLKNGMGALIDAFQASLTEDLLLNTKVSRIDKDNGRFHVHLADQDMIEADYVVLSIPHTAAESILADSSLTEPFSELKSSSLIGGITAEPVVNDYRLVRANANVFDYSSAKRPCT